MELINTEKTTDILTTNNKIIFSNKQFKFIKNNNEDKNKLINCNVLPEISLVEVSNHDNIEDCWIVIYDRVYDVTKFLSSHPGGLDTILDYGGRDATIPFRGTGHSADAIKLLNDFVIGELPMKERLFRKLDTDDGAKIYLSDIPI